MSAFDCVLQIFYDSMCEQCEAQSKFTNNFKLLNCKSFNLFFLNMNSVVGSVFGRLTL